MLEEKSNYIRKAESVGIVDWNELSVYLRVDKKLSTSSLMPLKSKHRILSEYFTSLQFNRKNYNLFISSLCDRGSKPGYINKFISLGKHIDRYMEINQLQDYTYYRSKPNNYIQLLSPDNIEQLANVYIKYARDTYNINFRMKVIINILGRTGCRIESELLQLRWSDVFINFNELQSSFLIFRDTKNGDDRKVYLKQSLAELINQIPKEGELVFPYSRQKVSEDIKRRARAIGLNIPIWPHLFRHSYIDTMSKIGVPLKYIQEVVGHKSITSTEKYIHPDEKDLLRFMEYHPLEKKQQSFDEVVTLTNEFVAQRIDYKQYSFTFVITEKASGKHIERKML